MTTFRVKAVAEASGVTVRTLHHYDEIGLLVPSGRTESGYRLYSEADLLRLQQILLHRELGLSLERIRQILDDPTVDTRALLLSQRATLAQRIERNEAMLRSIDRALAMLETQRRPDMSTLFDGFDPAQYEEETRQRWGGTAQFEISVARTKKYGPDDWKRIKEELDAVMSDLAKAMEAGRDPGDPAVADIVERHRLHIDRWFYPCDQQQHAGLAGLYESDVRFAENIDRHGTGLAAFLVAAIRSR